MAEQKTKMTKKTLQMILDARIRRDYRWVVRRKNKGENPEVVFATGDSGTQTDEVKKDAQAVFDEIADSLSYNDALVQAVQALGDEYTVDYVAKVIKAGLKSGAIVAEAAAEAATITEAGNWIAGAIKKPGALRKTSGVKKGKKIPKGDLEAMAKNKKAPKTAARARLAMTLRKFAKKGKKK